MNARNEQKAFWALNQLPAMSVSFGTTTLGTDVFRRVRQKLGRIAKPD
jgi:hypothetical protein